MTDRELMQQALDALEKMKAHSYLRLDYAEEAINALRDRLAQPEQEPVAWGVDWGKAGDIACVSIIKRLPNDVIEVVAVEYAPYSYTTPPQRTWVGLTEEEIKECFTITPDLFLPWHIYTKIETKLKEKNA